MEHRSTFQVRIAGAIVHELDVMAEIEADSIGEWYAAAIYVDRLLRPDGTVAGGYEWVRVPGTDRFYSEIMRHFHVACRSEIDDRWSRHSWRYSGERAAMFNDAGRTLA